MNETGKNESSKHPFDAFCRANETKCIQYFSQCTATCN